MEAIGYDMLFLSFDYISDYNKCIISSLSSFLSNIRYHDNFIFNNSCLTFSNIQKNYHKYKKIKLFWIKKVKIYDWKDLRKIEPEKIKFSKFNFEIYNIDKIEVVNMKASSYNLLNNADFFNFINLLLIDANKLTITFFHNIEKCTKIPINIKTLVLSYFLLNDPMINIITKKNFINLKKIIFSDTFRTIFNAKLLLDFPKLVYCESKYDKNDTTVSLIHKYPNNIKYLKNKI